MSTIDVTDSAEVMASVSKTASDDNDWVADGILRFDDHTGLVLVYSPEAPTDSAYGTVLFTVVSGGIAFVTERLSMSRVQALESFATRAKLGVSRIS